MHPPLLLQKHFCWDIMKNKLNSMIFAILEFRAISLRKRFSMCSKFNYSSFNSKLKKLTPKLSVSKEEKKSRTKNLSSERQSKEFTFIYKLYLTDSTTVLQTLLSTQSVLIIEWESVLYSFLILANYHSNKENPYFRRIEKLKARKVVMSKALVSSWESQMKNNFSEFLRK